MREHVLVFLFAIGYVCLSVQVLFPPVFYVASTAQPPIS